MQSTWSYFGRFFRYLHAFIQMGILNAQRNTAGESKISIDSNRNRRRPLF
ncbi:hypothetical protein PLANPX_4935 [Lacipirellula parvula]|uniref:Uncharacterized protein n=1 Tax=Lacipirellula parvula TaxID=2650471 RepID=A0A5K7XLF7_9BACT|nr:hypothetical protein PLANPX_4935 [Lacipirellula parvula]